MTKLSDQISLDEVGALYLAVLGREIDPGARDYFGAKGAEALRRGEVLRFLFNSDEFAARPAALRQAAWAGHPELGELERSGIKWFHSMEFPDGSRSSGVKPIETLRTEAAALFKHGVTGKSVLDIGAWDGFFSFEAERRGAARVLSTDWFCWGGPGWGTKAGYDYAHRQLASRCESFEVDLFGLQPEALGTFDVVLFLGVLYHLKDPFGGIERAAAMAGERIIVETATAQNNLKEPVMQFLPSKSLNADPTNFFSPNTACIVAMLRECGFSRFEVLRNPVLPAVKGAVAQLRGGHSRHIVYGWR